MGDDRGCTNARRWPPSGAPPRGRKSPCSELGTIIGRGEQRIDPDAAGSEPLFDRGAAGTSLMLRLTATNGESTDVVHPSVTTADQSLAMIPINTDVQAGARQFSFRAPATVALQANTPLD